MALLERGLGVRGIARQIGCPPSSVSRWQAEVAAGARTRSERSRLQAPVAVDAPAEAATAEVTPARGHGQRLPHRPLDLALRGRGRRPGVRGHKPPAHVWKSLRGCGWSCQKPERRTRERDEAATQRRLAVRWPDLKEREPGRS